MIENILEPIFVIGTCTFISFVYVYGMEWLSKPREMKGPPDINLDDIKQIR